jgi:protein lifeguard
MVMGGKTFAISPDEYVFAAVQIYLDIVLLFLNILQILGIAQS